MAAVIADLPHVLPVFAVSGALLLPGARLPLTVFEPRYLALTEAALAAKRLFALVQPAPDSASGPAPGLYATGILARISAFGEAGDGRYMITATGMNRFRIVGEAEGTCGYRRVVVDYRPYPADMGPVSDTLADAPLLLDRQRLLTTVVTYLNRQGVGTNTAQLEKCSDEELVLNVAMSAPLSPEEKQALLETATIEERANLMIALFEMALLAEAGDSVLH